MKTLPCILAIYIILLGSALRAETINDITLTSGRVLKNVEVIRWEKDRVVLKYAGGADPVAFSLIKSISQKDLIEMRDKALAEQEGESNKDRKKLERARALEGLVSQNKVAAGMTADQVRRSWGAPNKINASGGDYGHREQWVYPENYVYIDDGFVTSWSSSR